MKLRGWLFFVLFPFVALIAVPRVFAQNISWKDGKTTVTLSDARLDLSNRLQFRFTETDPEDGQSIGSFRIRRARTKLDGWAYSKNLRFEIQLDWADSTSSLLDADIAWDAAGRGAFVVKAGQFKAPFGRQELVSATSLQFVDRSIVSAAFAKGRDVGVQLSGLTLSRTIDWRIGVFNGNGRSATRNDNGKYQYDARVTWQPFGDVKYSEADLEGSDHPLVALAADWESNDQRGATSGNDLLNETTGTDVVFKYRGLFAYGEYFDRNSTPESGAKFRSSGLVAEIGWLIVPRKVEIAGRWARIDPSNLVASDDRTETGVAVSWYLHGHNLKLQSDFRALKDESKAATDHEGRIQMQMIF